MANGNFGGGYGTTSSPFLVEDAADLQAISKHLNRNFKQVRDIDLSKIERWEAIGIIGVFGTTTRFNYFTGSFDGNDYVIKNMKIVDYWKGEPIVGGLFAGTQNATIINVILEEIFIDVYDTRVGMLVHQANENTIIKNCKVRNCNINTTAPGIGGLVYVTFRGATIEDCEVSDVLITHNTGNFHSTGTRGEMQPIGGLVGQAYEGGSKNLKTTISRCAVKNIEMIRKNSTVWWVDHSYADVGGLIGQCDRGNIIKDCYVQGYMKDKEIHSNQKLGGLIGFFVGDGESQIINCYAAVKADIDWKLSEKDANYGGLFGYGTTTEHDSIVNSYYDQQLFNGGNGIGESRTTSDMKNKSNYIDWDFDHVWAIRSNADYPFLHYRKDDIKYHMCKSTDFPLDIRKMKRR